MRRTEKSRWVVVCGGRRAERGRQERGLAGSEGSAMMEPRVMEVLGW